VEAELLYALLDAYPYVMRVPDILEHYWPEGKEEDFYRAIQKLKDDGIAWMTPCELDDETVIDVVYLIRKLGEPHRRTGKRKIEELKKRWPFYR
jgi:hypothetical protein